MEKLLTFLQKNNIIPIDYAQNLRKIIAFRNILVYEYVDLDLKEVYKNLQNLEDLRKFI